MTPDPCPFCLPDPERVFYRGATVLGIWDGFPVTEGHALLVTRAHRRTWFDATEAERHELTAAIEVARDAIVQRDSSVADFNVGLNIGGAAGQTVFHVHLHVIPRRPGDVADARGGVRNVIPSKRLYGRHLEKQLTGRMLTTGEDFPLLPHLGRELERATRLDVAVAFVMPSGVEKLYPHLEDLLGRGGTFRLVTGDYLDITDPDALRQLMDLALAFPRARVDLRVFHKPGTSFHPKAYILDSGNEQVAFVGSSNVSSSALLEGIEWNYRVVTSRENDGLGQIRSAFESLFLHPSVRPIDEAWLLSYEARRRLPGPMPLLEVSDEAIEPPAPPPIPNAVQVEALADLRETRQQGFHAGLVVMATGLGKTWLAAFDTEPFKRVLFVAHREEILTQALHTFRRVRPHAKFGRFNGEEKAPDAEVLFASIATLSRQVHLEAFDRKAFDYIVVDEFHHASASTYRRLIEYFEPKFLLGLTATPHRTDGDDLLGLCQENLVFECDVVRGITQGLLSPFAYFGVPDTIDYENIPWRSTRFDEAKLTEAAATELRAQNILEQWRARAGQRTLAFCVSQLHADFMKRYFTQAGVACAAVHSGANSDPRQGSLERLVDGTVRVVFAVDMFNEGVDLPAIDTVMMLRPTESAIIWLQQFGRGLRISPGKDRLTVIDYIGNHRSFLLKARTLLQVPAGSDTELNAALLRVAAGEYELPPGCSVTYELQALEIMRTLLRLPTAAVRDALLSYYQDFKERRGERPTALQCLHDGYNPRSARRPQGSWLEFVEQQGDLDAAQARARVALADFLTTLEVTPMTKSYKMVTVVALLNRGAMPGSGLPMTELLSEVRRVALNDPRLKADFGDALESDQALRRLLEQNPIAAWVKGEGTGGTSFFSYDEETFRLRGETPEVGPTQGLIREVVDWRLAEYFRRQPELVGHFTLKVSHATGRPILFYPSTRDGIPEGWTKVQIDGQAYEANFVTVALNVVRRIGETSNELPTILRGWFGADAGLPGTNHQVSLVNRSGQWTLEKAAGVGRDTLELWRSYSREQIPGLFGETFSEAIWNVGFVVRPPRAPKHVFLLVTIDKGDMHGDFDYGDHFLSPDLFEWQSQNRTTQNGSHGQLIREHAKRGVPVHLFVRKQKKDGKGNASPFVYCGPVTFKSWKGEKPITVEWTLGQLLPDRFFVQFRKP
jgi:superfamily II DNA or RNA helicase/HKD family nuclease